MSSGTAAKHTAALRIIKHSPLTYWKVSPSSLVICSIRLPAMYMFTFRLQWKTPKILLHSTHVWWFTQVTMSTFLFPLQRVTATSMPDAVDSTWSCISCQGGRAEGSAWTAATTLRAATATTARRVFTETWPGRSLTDEPVKVRVQQKCSAAASTTSRCEFIYL